MQRFSPAVIRKIAATLVIVLGPAVVIVPRAMADPVSTTAAPVAQFADVAWPSLTPTPDPTPAATPATSPTASPALALAPTPRPTARPKPKYRDTVENARLYVKRTIGLTQYNCIDQIWYHESRWNPRAIYPAGGDPATASYGIPQAHPGIKMAAFGSNWRTSPLTQVKWGIWYVDSRYGSACAAYAFKAAHGWY